MAQPIGALRALVLDEDEQVRKLMLCILHSRGYRAFGVGTGREALDRIATEHFDLVVADHSPPGLDGLAIIRATRQRLPKSAGILLCAGSADVEMHAKADQLTCPVLRKPFESADLRELLDQLIPSGKGAREFGNRGESSSPVVPRQRER